MTDDIEDRLRDFARWWNDTQPPPPDATVATGRVIPTYGPRRSRHPRRTRRIAIAGATLATLAVIAATSVIADHAGNDSSTPPAVNQTTPTPIATTASATPTPTNRPPADPVDARLLAIADRAAATDHGTATHVDAVLTTQNTADSVLSPGTSEPVNTTRVWLIDISGPTRYVCDTCFFVTAAPTGTHAQLIVDATTYVQTGKAIDDLEPDLEQAGPVRVLR